jgi:tRNA threonylcarbamoyladenosine biosynthesis protein TsaE
LDCPAVITLTGELGSGKTCFVQGLAEGLETPPEYYITSPSYTLVNEYPGRCTFYHIDLYRLDSVEDAAEIGLDDALYGEGVAAIEWPDRLPEGLIADPIAVHIAFDPGDETHRRIEVTIVETEKWMAALERFSQDGP